jgi:hypothetical protein
MGKFGRDAGEMVEGDKNFNIKDERGDDGEVTVEGRESNLWGSPFGSWEDEGTFANESEAKDFIDEEQSKGSGDDSSGEDSEDSNSDDE